jgi:hypothetical protein
MAVKFISGKTGIRSDKTDGRFADGRFRRKNAKDYSEGDRRRTEMGPSGSLD